jgi:hypothetical protein
MTIEAIGVFEGFRRDRRISEEEKQKKHPTFNVQRPTSKAAKHGFTLGVGC